MNAKSSVSGGRGRKRINNFSHLLYVYLVNIPRRFQHIASIICGFALLYFTLGLGCLYSLAFTVMTHLLFITVTTMNLKSYGITLTSFCLITLTIGFVY